jgi:hypothetical protein
MAVPTRAKKFKAGSRAVKGTATAGARPVAKHGGRGGKVVKAKVQRAAKRRTVPAKAGREQIVRQAVGATLFDPAAFVGWYERCAASRAKHWDAVRGGDGASSAARDPGAD